MNRELKRNLGASKAPRLRNRPGLAQMKLSINRQVNALKKATKFQVNVLIKLSLAKVPTLME